MKHNAKKAYKNGHIMSPSFENYRMDTVMVTKGEKIDYIGPTDTYQSFEDTEIVDVNDGFVIPAFFDFHMHVTEPWVTNEMELYTGFGVAGVRDMGSNADTTRKISTSIRNGQRTGPGIYSYGELVDGPQPRWPDISVIPQTMEDVESHVKRCKARGLFGVKFYHKLSHNFLEHGLRVCREQELLSSGHLGDRVNVSEAIKMGIGSVEHVVTLSKDLVPDGALREEDGFWHYFGPFLAWHDHVSLDAPITDILISQLVSSGTILVPTLALSESVARGNESFVTANPYLDLIEDRLLAEWEVARKQREFETEHFEIASEAFEKMKMFVLQFAEAGGTIGVGTDAPNPYIVPGASLHRELALLVDAGIEPSIVLRQACQAPAEWLDESGTWGNLTEGQQANFLILEKDPLQDIAATQRIRWIVINGKHIDPIRVD
jgi:hypothetical protein